MICLPCVKNCVLVILQEHLLSNEEMCSRFILNFNEGLIMGVPLAPPKISCHKTFSVKSTGELLIL